MEYEESELRNGTRLASPLLLPRSCCFTAGMEPYETTRLVYSRVQALDPENVSKIIGYLLLQGNCEHEMLKLALGSDMILHSVVAKAKKELGLIPRPMPQLPNQQLAGLQVKSNMNGPVSSSQLSKQLTAQLVPQPASLYTASHIVADNANINAQYYENPLISTNGNASADQMLKLASMQDKIPLYCKQSLQSDQLFSLVDIQNSPAFFGGVFPNDHFYPETVAFLNSSRARAERSAGWNLPEMGSSPAWKPCVYFARGYCKHGSNCRFLHTSLKDDNSGPSSPNSSQWELAGEDGIEIRSLETLESELQELLSAKKAPISIASLPQLYYERFGRTLQAEGYLTESQRHGKAGFNLTKLLARLKNTITLIDRPHGQHAVVLTEDAHKFNIYQGERFDLSGVNPSSRQIYLTFPAESLFTEEDVNTHFRAYGPVQDVRIPYQQKRMFGFVTFVYPETVKTVLSEGNPHYICGARVLVKPYRERGKHGDKKPLERGDNMKFLAQQQLDVAAALMEESHSTDLERRLRELELIDAQADASACFQISRDKLQERRLFTQAKAQETCTEEVQFPEDETFGFLNVLDKDNGDDGDKSTNIPKDTQQRRNGDILPESLFTSPIKEKIQNYTRTFIGGASTLDTTSF